MKEGYQRGVAKFVVYGRTPEEAERRAYNYNETSKKIKRTTKRAKPRNEIKQKTLTAIKELNQSGLGATKKAIAEILGISTEKTRNILDMFRKYGLVATKKRTKRNGELVYFLTKSAK
jgi:DNA-directed RNA polymerase specialized sigma subunit